MTKSLSVRVIAAVAAGTVLGSCALGGVGGGMLLATVTVLFVIPVTVYVGQRFGRRRTAALGPAAPPAPDAPPVPIGHGKDTDS
jgi:hypothetical protein